MSKTKQNLATSLLHKVIKRAFDLIFSLLGLILTFWIIILAFIIATIDTKNNGFFTQIRIGRKGKPFKVIKIRTMKEVNTINTTITSSNDIRITKMGRIFRKTKIDELPQLINVLLGHMSFVGPRPDVPGFADRLTGEDRIILEVRPGITGPATLKYRNEEDVLSKVDDPEKYNKEVIFPDKVNINKEYIKNYTFFNDIKIIIETIFGKKEHTSEYQFDHNRQKTM